MSLRPVAKHCMIYVGIASILVILLLHVFPEISGPFADQVKTAQATEQNDNTEVAATPADAIPGGAPMQISEVGRTLIDTLLNENTSAAKVNVFTHILGDYLSVLLRASISPNAP